MTTDLTTRSTSAISEHGEVDISAVEEFAEELKKEKAERDAQMGFLPKLEEGKTILRILPPWRPGVKLPWKRLFLHRIPNPNAPDDFPLVVPCPQKNDKKSCIACAEVKRLRAAGKKDEAKELASKPRFFANVVRNEPEPHVFKWEFGQTIMDALMEIMLDGDYGDITHPQTGRLLHVTRKGTGMMDTRYSVIPGGSQRPLPDMSVLERLHDLDNARPDIDTEEVRRFMSGEVQPAEGATDFDPAKFEEEKDAEYIPPK